MLPDVEGLGTNDSIGSGGYQMSTRMEVTVDKCVSGEKVLSLLRRFESLHLTFAASCRSM